MPKDRPSLAFFKATASTADAGEAGAPEAEIEITPLMIEAGVEALAGRYFDLVDSYGYPEIAKIVFEAMAAVSGRFLRVVDQSAEYRLECHRKDA
jgi:hypothetical protein